MLLSMKRFFLKGRAGIVTGNAAQSANINIVSGATQDSQAYKSSLSDALSQT
jgi:uncharacterized protein with FMN-binding domain